MGATETDDRLLNIRSGTLETGDVQANFQKIRIQGVAGLLSMFSLLPIDPFVGSKQAIP